MDRYQDYVDELVQKYPQKLTQVELHQLVSQKFPHTTRSMISSYVTRNQYSKFLLGGRSRVYSTIVELEGSLHVKGDDQMAKKTEEAPVPPSVSKMRRMEQQLSDTQKQVRNLQDTIVLQEDALSNLGVLKDYEPTPIIIIPRTKSRSESTAVALFSDLHVEEVVEKHKVDGLNEYNPKIAKRRSARFFELVVRMIKKERVDVDIFNLVLWLGGDFFSSNLHKELPAACAMPPMPAAKLSLDIITGGIEYILAELPDITISIPTSVGNHSRMTEKVYVATEQEHSVEWLMYTWLESRYKNNKRVKVTVATGANTYIDVYNRKIRFAHGHIGLKYNQGLAGIHGPLRKKIEQVWNKQVEAYMTCIGHYHQYIPSSRSSRYVVNGSVIGTSPYGMQFGHEEPTQAFFLIDRHKGLTVQIPLLVDR